MPVFLKRKNTVLYMAKETTTPYMSHDVDARQDEKVLQLRAIHGWAGYGLFWAIIETLAEGDNYKFKHKYIDGLALSLNLTKDELLEFLNHCYDIELFSKDDEYFWSESLMKRLTERDAKIAAHKKHGQKGAAARWNKQDGLWEDDDPEDDENENEDNDSGDADKAGGGVSDKPITNQEVMPNHSPANRGANSTLMPIKLNKIKLNKIEEKEVEPQFREPLRLSKKLFQLITENDPKARPPNGRWVEHVEKMHRLDDRTYDQIEKVMEWSQNNDFWKTVILSTKKLRDKFPQLNLQMQRDRNGKPKSDYQKRRELTAADVAKSIRDSAEAIEAFGNTDFDSDE